MLAERHILPLGGGESHRRAGGRAIGLAERPPGEAEACTCQMNGTNRP